MQGRIRKFYEYSLAHKPLPEVELILHELSSSLRESLAFELYGKYFTTFPLLAKKSSNFLAWIGPRLQVQVVVDGLLVDGE